MLITSKESTDEYLLARHSGCCKIRLEYCLDSISLNALYICNMFVFVLYYIYWVFCILPPAFSAVLSTTAYHFWLDYHFCMTLPSVLSHTFAMISSVKLSQQDIAVLHWTEICNKNPWAEKYMLLRWNFQFK